MRVQLWGVCQCAGGTGAEVKEQEQPLRRVWGEPRHPEAQCPGPSPLRRGLRVILCA